MVESLKRVLGDIKWEIIFVDDDSVDGTSKVVRQLASTDPRIRCIQRVNRRGLSSACIEGVLATHSPYLCVMDADMQHDETILPKMYSMLIDEDLDMVIGSRYVGEGSTGSLASHRRFISRAATKFSQLLLRVKISDPMSGYFMFSRQFFEKIMYKVSGKGFKILLDMLVSSPVPVKLQEYPYTMRSRVHGESKLSLVVVWDFLMLVLNRLLGALLPYRFLSFISVGFSGLFVHMFVLWVMHDLSSTDFTLAQSVATFVAMTTNYILNNTFTYHDNKKVGKAFWRGLLSFYLVCMVGAILNVALASELYLREIPWMISGICGAIAGSIWNFTISSIFVWNIEKQSRSRVDYE